MRGISRPSRLHEVTWGNDIWLDTAVTRRADRAETGQAARLISIFVDMSESDRYSHVMKRNSDVSSICTLVAHTSIK